MWLNIDLYHYFGILLLFYFTIYGTAEMGGLEEENREAEGHEGNNRIEESNPVADEIANVLEPAEQIDDNEATQMLLQLYSTMSKPINLLTQEELSWILKRIQLLAKWDDETVADTIDYLKNINSLNLHQSNYLISVLNNIHSFKLNEGQLIHLMGTIHDTHKLSTDQSNMKVTPLLSLLMVAEGKPVAWWEQKENNNIEVVNKRLIALHEELKRLVIEHTQFISDTEQQIFIQFLGEIGWKKDNFLLTKEECDCFTTWLSEENRFTDEKLLEIKETIKTIGGAISSQYKSLKNIVDAIQNKSTLDKSETEIILEIHNEIIVTAVDKENFELLIKAHKPFIKTQEQVYLLKVSVVSLLKYILGLIELIEELDRSKVNQPTLVQSATPGGLKTSYGTKSIGELWLNEEVLKNTMQGTHTAFIKLDTLMRQEGVFFEHIFSDIKSPVSQLSEETIVYLTTILSKIYEFDEDEYIQFFNEMCCTKGIGNNQIAQLAEFCISLRAISAEEFRNLASNMYQIFHLVKNKAEWIKKSDTERNIDPLAISAEGLLALHSESVSESYEVIKRPLHVKNFHMTLWEISGYKEKKNNVIETIHGFSDSLLKNNRQIYVQLVNNIANLPENQNINEIASTTALKRENRKLHNDHAEVLSHAIIEYYHLFKNIEAVSMLTHEEILSVLEIALNSENESELHDKLLQRFTVDSQYLNDKDCEFLTQMITNMQQFFEIQLDSDQHISQQAPQNNHVSINMMGTEPVSLKKLLSERTYTSKDMKRNIRANSTKKSKNEVENILISAGINQEEWAMHLALYLFVDRGSNKDPWIANMIFEHPELGPELQGFITQVQHKVVEKTGKILSLTDSLLF